MQPIWIVWLLIVAGSFGVLEYVGLRQRREATLSAYLRRWLGIAPARPWRRVGIAGFTAIVLGFTVWFIPHITTSIW